MELAAIMTPEERALAAAFMAECWPTVREESREERAVKRALDAAFPARSVHRDLHKSTATESAGMDAECA